MPTYSNSRLSTFESCPLQFRLRYVDQLPVPPRESVEAFLGKRVHEALERLYQSVERGYKPTMAEMLASFRDSWEREWSDAIHVVRSGETVRGYQLIAERCLVQYYKRHDPFDRGRTVGAELLVSYPLDPEKDIHLQGYVDRLVDLGNGNYEIHDYKTSRRLPTQVEIDRDRQLALYQMGVTLQVPDVASIRLVWHYLAHDRTLVSTRTPEQLRELRASVLALIGRVEQAIAAGDFPARISSLCNWCDYRPVCPAHGAAAPAPAAQAPAAAPAAAAPASTAPGSAVVPRI
jgi:putative RecB family exonuclease